MEHLQKKMENIPATENLIQKKQETRAIDEEAENSGIKSKSFMETSDSILGASSKDSKIEPPLTFDIWFPADGTVNLDAFQLNLLNQIASDSAITSGAATISGIKGGSLTTELPGSDLGGVLETANFRANAVDIALGNPGATVIPSLQTVTNYKRGVITNSEAETRFVNGNEVKVTILFNTERGRTISRIKDLALQLDSYTR